jgi:hypothetical protein
VTPARSDQPDRPGRRDVSPNPPSSTTTNGNATVNTGGKLSNLSVTPSGGLGPRHNLVVTVMVNGNATALSCCGGGSCTDTSDTVTLDAGDVVNFEIANSGVMGSGITVTVTASYAGGTNPIE